MKILFCIYDQPGYTTAGINAWMQRLIPDLVSNYKLDITTLIIYSGDKKQCPTVRFFDENNLKASLVRFSKIKYTEDGVKKVLEIVKKKQIRVIVANHVVPVLYAHKYLKEFNVPVIPVFHSSGPEALLAISKFVNTPEFGIKDSVSVSSYINSQIKNTDKDKHIIIPCGTPINNVYAKIPQKNIKVIYAGRIETEAKQIIKITESFINISQKHDEFTFNIYGNGSKQKDVENLISINSNHRVIFHGAVEPHEIINIIAQHHIFTLMSDYEGMPIALMEAMACGVVPVCLSEESGVNTLINNGVNGFIVKNRTTDYEEKLLLLQNNPELWQKMSLNAIQTIKEKYSSQITHKNWAKYLKTFNHIRRGTVKTPSKIVLDSELLTYHDNRRPNLNKRLLIDIKDLWNVIHYTLRPRARYRKLKKHFSKNKKDS